MSNNVPSITKVDFYKHRGDMTASLLERLAILSEESSEVIQMINKIIRFGMLSSNPLFENSQTNKELLEEEIGHLLSAIELISKDLNVEKIKISKDKKNKSRTQFTLYQ